MFENLSEEQFEHILNLLIVYKQSNPKKDVYLNEQCIREALDFMKNHGKEFADKLGMKE